MLAQLLRLSLYWPKSVLLVCIGLLLELAFLSGLPYSFRFIVDDGILAGDHVLLRQILIFLALGALMFALVGYVRDRTLAKLIARMLERLRAQMLERCHEAPLFWLEQRRRSDLTNRFSADLGSVEQALHSAAPFAVLPALEVVANTLLLFTLDWRLALLSLLVFPAALLGPRFLMPRAAKAADLRRQTEAQVLAAIDEQLAAQRTARSFGMQSSQLARFHRESAQLTARIRLQGLLSALVERTANSAILLLNVAVLAFGCWQVLHGDITVGELAAFQSLFLSLSWALSYLAQYAPIWVSGQSSLGRLREVLAAPKLDTGKGESMTRMQRGISCRKLGFAYGERVILRDLNFELPSGRSLALVGTSGSGKSTLLSLILGFETPSQGEILIDGKPLRQIDLASWRRQLGVVFQDTYLFVATVADNLRVGKSDASQAELELAARQAGIHEVIMGLPKAYETLLGETHVTLSGGQRQRIGIARALLRLPNLLVLDEPTSSLDVATEQQIQETLFQVGRGRSILLVTHRLEQAARCDQILVFEQGAIVERGAHAELLALGGRYAVLWRKQHGFSFDGASARISSERLADTALFAELPENVLARIASMFSTEHARAGELLIRQGEVGDRFYLLARGMAEVYRLDESGKEHSIAILSDGDPFGEIALLAERARTANVRALLDCTLLTLSKAQLDAILQELPQVATRMRMTAMSRLKIQR